jgi:lysophospholipase L1-like esterase
MKGDSAAKRKSVVPAGSHRFGAALLAAAATLAVLELLLRVLDPLGMKYFPEADRYFRAMVPDTSFAYIHRAGYRGSFQGVEVSINSHGFRAPEWRMPKPAGRARLMILGDSVVFGWGAPQDSIFPVLLQREFDAEGLGVEVLAAGVGSWNTRTEYEYLRTRGVDLGPDVLLLVITSNDLVPKTAGRAGADGVLSSERPTGGGAARAWIARAWRFAGKHSYVLSHIQYLSKRRAESRGYASADSDSPRWRDARSALEGIVELCRGRDISLSVCLYTNEQDLAGNAVLTLYRNALEERGVSSFTLPRGLFSEKRYRNSFVDGHANARGQALIAERVHDELYPLAERAALRAAPTE